MGAEPVMAPGSPEWVRAQEILTADLPPLMQTAADLLAAINRSFSRAHAVVDGELIALMASIGQAEALCRAYAARKAAKPKRRR